ncbi:Sialyltransferase-like protein 2 [Vitis vinifera]|uniref:Sialyltransferase-like protein 2 n=1 Tax=Vitis vinifera TaxID=29760 RepID=A0A438EY47_VITVI|nr:Sialyltransferase-like protein 2 [Vitis vinifera]
MRLLQFGLILALASGFAAIIIYINGLANIYEKSLLSDEDLGALESLQSGFQKCVYSGHGFDSGIPKKRWGSGKQGASDSELQDMLGDCYIDILGGLKEFHRDIAHAVGVILSSNGLGLQAARGRDYCQVTIKFPSDTVPKWVASTRDIFFSFEIEHENRKIPKPENLKGYHLILISVKQWLHGSRCGIVPTILTKEFIDALPNGWTDYAWRRINKGILLNNCKNKTLAWRNFLWFGKEIDGYDAVIRENGAPIENYTAYVGKKSTFRLLNRGSAKALDKVVELDETRKEALIIKTTVHDIMNKMIQEVPIHNPVYLMLGASFGSAAKGTGLKALEFALSICESVDMYGFTVDPGYKEWTRYFSESRQGHTPLHGRAYYQMMECLGLIKIHSPMRADPNRIVTYVPSHSTVTAARIASEKLLRRVGAGSGEPLHACSIIKKQLQREPIGISSIRKAAVDHKIFVKGATMYPLEHSPGHGLLCTVPN